MTKSVLCLTRELLENPDKDHSWPGNHYKIVLGPTQQCLGTNHKDYTKPEGSFLRIMTKIVLGPTRQFLGTYDQDRT